LPTASGRAFGAATISVDAMQDGSEGRATRAVVCSQLGDEHLLEYRDDWPVGPCEPGKVRIDVRAASVNFPDTLIIRGQYQHKPDLPLVPGNECSGVVVEVGESVDGVSVGDRVLALVGTGAFAACVIASWFRRR